jgi:hypothetical protein
MVRAPEISSQDQWSSGRRNPTVRRGRGANAAPLNRGLRRLALCMSVGASFLAAAGVAVSQNTNTSLPEPDARMKAPIGHRQPRPSDLPPSVQRDEQLNPPPAQTPPQNQTSNGGARAANVPTIDFRKGCQEAEKDMASIFGPLSGPTVGTCLQQERDARQQIINNWAKYHAEDRQKCINTTAYLPSYVEWITCLEMYRDVRSLDNTPKDQAQTSGTVHRGSHHR